MNCHHFAIMPAIFSETIVFQKAKINTDIPHTSLFFNFLLEIPTHHQHAIRDFLALFWFWAHSIEQLPDF